MVDKRLIETNFSEGIKTETVYSVREDSLMEGSGMLVGTFELNP